MLSFKTQPKIKACKRLGRIQYAVINNYHNCYQNITFNVLILQY